MCKVWGIIIVWIKRAIYLVILQPLIQKINAARCNYLRDRRQACQ